MGNDYTNRSTTELQELKELVLQRIAAVPEFRRGSLQIGYRKCGKKTCRCAQPGQQGHGPRGLWNRTGPGGDSRGQYVPVADIATVQSELGNYEQFADIITDYIEINEALCMRRMDKAKGRKKPAPPAFPAPGGEKGGIKPRP